MGRFVLEVDVVADCDDIVSDQCQSYIFVDALVAYSL